MDGRAMKSVGVAIDYFRLLQIISRPLLLRGNGGGSIAKGEAMNYRLRRSSGGYTGAIISERRVLGSRTACSLALRDGR